jgi:16S rRNA (cytidine1402-2'-O)-methyltransferase
VLILAGTPIGDSTYASEALKTALVSADVIAAEDTREMRTLLARISVSVNAEVISYFDGNETERTPLLLNRLVSGKTVVLVTDAGMPSVSDPGFRLTRAAIDAGVRVTCVPGPSAVLTALAVSGLGVERFCFEGFLPRKPGERETRLGALRDEERTMVFFEAPHRLPAFLIDAAEAFGLDRQGAICRELTKPHEEVIRGELTDLIEWAADGVRGETTVVIAGRKRPATSGYDALSLVRARVSDGEKLSSAVTEVAEMTGVRRKDLYELAVGARAAQTP